ncbi:hypothetical protein CDL12_25036 [Handroanthus impetiginosus]|uniref:DUF8040 domain-containing protein n=1 Tax=Handroanthus impetiginosus TaxID=429701 RepID=A0A2G9GAZ1_9LAMI|nr:hypothetical protein CDL12_25036 [Handroanthus impetiginosus]
MDWRTKIYVFLWLSAFIFLNLMLRYINNLHIDRNTLLRLCYLLNNLGGMRNERFVIIHENFACFLLVLSYQTKNMIVKHNFKWPGRTINKYFNKTLKAVMKLSAGCLIAPDETYIEVRVCHSKQAHCRSKTCEGYAADNRVLRDTLNRSHGLAVNENWTRFHLYEYLNGSLAPLNPREYIKLKHSKARNVIQRALGILKSR